MNLNVRLIIPITWLALFTVLLMCSLKVNRLSMVTPMSFSAVVFLSPLSGHLLSLLCTCVLDVVVLFSRSCTCLGGIFRINFCDHVSSVLMSRCRDFRSSSADVTARYSLVLSANNLIEFSTVPGISLMNVKNRTGPRTLPCGTPLVTFTHSEQAPFTETCWTLLCRYDSIQRTSCRENLVGYQLCHQSSVWHSSRRFGKIEVNRCRVPTVGVNVQRHNYKYILVEKHQRLLSNNRNSGTSQNRNAGHGKRQRY